MGWMDGWMDDGTESIMRRERRGLRAVSQHGSARDRPHRRKRRCTGVLLFVVVFFAPNLLLYEVTRMDGRTDEPKEGRKGGREERREAGKKERKKERKGGNPGLAFLHCFQNPCSSAFSRSFLFSFAFAF